jgi:thioredoxin 1
MSAIFDTPVRTGVANLDRVLAAGRPMLLAFETPDCEPCRTLEPTLKELARDFAGRALVVVVGDTREGNLATRFRLARVPSLVYWHDGREVARIEGAADHASIRAFLQFLVGDSPRPAPGTGPSIPLGGASAPHADARSDGGNRATQDVHPVAVTDATFDAQVLQSPLPVLVDFWAPWCGPCRMVSPIVEEMGRQYAGRLRVAKVNTDENPAQASRLGIQGIPTLIFFKNGREVDRIVGAAPKPMLQSRVERVLKAEG